MTTQPNVRQIEDAIVSESADPTAGQLPVASGTGKEITWTDPSTAVLSNVDSITFNTAAGVSVSEGEIAWNDTDSTLDIGLSGGTVLQTGQEFLARILNTTGSTLTDGQAVYITGAQGNRTTVSLAQANNISADLTLGIVTQQILNNQEGFVTLLGLVRNFNTSAWLEGDELFLSASVAGGLTNVEPAAPNHSVHIGFVVRSHASVGIIFVRVHAQEGVSELYDVVLTSISDGDILAYDSGTQTWVNGQRGQVDTVVGGSNITVDATDPANPIANLDSSQTHVTFSLNTTDAAGTANEITAGTNSVLTWDWDGANTSASLDHNGSAVLTVDESGITGVSGEPVTMGANAAVNIGSGTGVANFGPSSSGVVQVGLSASNTVEIGGNQSGGSGVRIGERTTTGATTITRVGSIPDNVANAAAEAYIGVGGDTGSTTEVHICGTTGAGTNTLEFFGATPIAQPVLTTGSNEELTTALGSTSGLGLVDDSFTLSPLTQSSQTIAFNATRPINGPQRTMYPVDTTGGAFSGTMTGTFLPGDIIRFCDYASNFATANFTVDFGAHNFQSLASQTVVLNTDDIAVAYEYVDSTRGFQTI